MKRRIFWLLALVLSLPLGAQERIALLHTDRIRPVVHPIIQETTELEFELINDLILVKGTQERQDGYFILDTGAPMLVVNQQPDQQAAPGTQAGSLTQKVAVGETMVREASWSHYKLNNIPALQVDLSHLEKYSRHKILGLLGYDVIRTRECLFDLQRNKIFLFPAVENNQLHRIATPLTKMPFELIDHLPIVTLTYQGQTYRFALDSGSSNNLISEELYERERQGLQISSSVHLQTLSQEVVKTKEVALDPVFIGSNDIPLVDQTFVVSDFTHVQDQFGLKIDGILGVPFIKQFKFSINYGRKMMYIWEYQ